MEICSDSDESVTVQCHTGFSMYMKDCFMSSLFVIRESNLIPVQMSPPRLVLTKAMFCHDSGKSVTVNPLIDPDVPCTIPLSTSGSSDGSWSLKASKISGVANKTSTVGYCTLSDGIFFLYAHP